MSLIGSVMLSTSMISTTSVISGNILKQRFLQMPFLTTVKYSKCKLIPFEHETKAKEHNATQYSKLDGDYEKATYISTLEGKT